MEIFLCVLGALYLVAASFALVRNWDLGAHGLRRLRALDTVRVVVAAVAWPTEELSLRLREYFSQAWSELPTRYSGVPA